MDAGLVLTALAVIVFVALMHSVYVCFKFDRGFIAWCGRKLG